MDEMISEGKDQRELFAEYLQCLEAKEAVGIYNQLCLASPEGHGYKDLRDNLLPKLPYSHKALFGILDRALALREQYRSDSNCKRILISGAGPCGLRAAVESALLGHEVRVLELRGECSRHNILKTTQSTLDDLLSLGLKQYSPTIRTQGGVLHAGTHEIQMCLLKSALLLGVSIHLQEAVCGIVKPVEGDALASWSVWTLPEAEAREYLKRPLEKHSALSLKPGETDCSQFEKTSLVNFFEPALSQDGAISVEKKGRVQYKFDSLLVAEGESSRLIRNLGFDRQLTRFRNATGIVINIDLDDKSLRSKERRLPEIVISMTNPAGEYFGSLKNYLQKDIVRVENIEYMRGTNTHFIAMTANITEFHRCGIVKERFPTVNESLKGENMDFERLKDLGRQTASFLGIPDTAPFAKKNGIQAFDFSCKGGCAEPVRKLAQGDVSSLVMPIGDALQNPYWPQGLGVNMGFHGALDAVWGAHMNNSEEEVRAAHACFRYCVRPAVTTIQCGKSWTADPLTRYHRNIFSQLYYDELERKEKSILTDRMLTSIKISRK